jgi:uncharacterized membrane protein YccC
MKKIALKLSYTIQDFWEERIPFFLRIAIAFIVPYAIFTYFGWQFACKYILN